MPDPATTLPPVLTTERLTMRAPAASDFEDSAAMWSDPLVTRFIGGRTSTPEESWARLLRARGLWPVLGYGYWAVRETATGAYVGEVGFAAFRRAIVPPIDGVPEMGWALSPVAQGKGYGLEAVRAALAWGEGQWGAAPVVCIIDPINTPSLKLAARAGFVETGRAVYKDEPTIVLQRG
jgi:RimJ/RimL family protein N-acetyltransferase